MLIEFNRNKSSFNCDFTIEFNVKNPTVKNIPEDLWQHEYETGQFTNKYGDKCFAEIRKVIKSKKWYVKDWSFAGRSNGWFVLLCNESAPGHLEPVTEVQVDKITKIVDKYLSNYGQAMEEFYFLKTA